MKYMLRNLQKQIFQRSKNPFCAYGPDKIHLSTRKEYVPNTVDWRKFGLRKIGEQRDGSCWAYAPRNNLTVFSKLVGKRLVLPLKSLLDCDHRCNLNDDEGGYPEFALQYCMMNGVLRPRKYSDSFPSLGERVPISGYLKLFPTEEMLIRATAQQPVLITMLIGRNFIDYTGGIYEGESSTKNLYVHFMNVIGYTEEYYIAENSWSVDWGENGYIRIRRGIDVEGGVGGMYRRMYIPYYRERHSLDHLTTLNSYLLENCMDFSHIHLGCFCPRSMEYLREHRDRYPPEYLREILPRNKSSYEE